MPDLSPLINTHKAGDTVTIGFDRDGKPMTGDVTLIASPDDRAR